MSIPAHITAIKSLRLSIAGQIKLAKYSQTAIEHADIQIQKRNNIQRPFNYFERLAKDQQDVEGEPLDYATYNNLVAIHGEPAVGKELLENKVIKWDVPKRPLGAKNDKAAQERSLKKDGYAARHTSGSNAQADWWSETIALRETDHDEYIRRIRSKRKTWNQPNERTHDEENSIDPSTSLNIAWDAYCQTDAGVVQLANEKANPDLNGSSFQSFLATDIGQYWLTKQRPVVRQILQPLLRKDYTTTRQAADETGARGAVSEPTPSPLSAFKDIALWHENTVLAQTVTPYLDETSNWEEIYE